MKKILLAVAFIGFCATFLKAFDTFLPPKPINPGSIEKLSFRVKTIEEGDPRQGIPVKITVTETPFGDIEGRQVYKMTRTQGRWGVASAEFDVRTSGHYEVRIAAGKLMDGRDRPEIVKQGIFQHIAANKVTIEREINLSW